MESIFIREIIETKEIANLPTTSIIRSGTAYVAKRAY
jgi:hypothetical protein